MPNQKHPSSSYARILFRHLRLSEENCQAYFAGTNVSYAELMTLDGTIARDQLIQIYRNALVISGHDDLGLSVGAQLHLSTHGPLGVATFTGPDLRAGLNLLARFGQTRTDFFDISVSEHPQGLRVRFAETFDLGDLRAFVTESVLSGLFSAINFIVGEDRFNGAVRFSYAKPEYWLRYKDHFGGNLGFNHSVTQIVIPESLLAIPSPVADPVMYREAVAECERQLEQIRSGESEQAAPSTTETVSKLIAENPGKIWTLGEVSSNLNMSTRTLIRRLESEGTKFQSVRDEVAKKQAASYLSDAGLSVESVGHLMGFSDTSSFRRTFKRWFGETPSQYIARVRHGPN